MAEVTAWYPGTIKPVRVGMYQRQFGPSYTAMSRWDGKQWRHHEWPEEVSHRQELPWRGLSARPTGTDRL